MNGIVEGERGHVFSYFTDVDDVVVVVGELME